MTTYCLWASSFCLSRLRPSIIPFDSSILLSAFPLHFSPLFPSSPGSDGGGSGAHGRLSPQGSATSLASGESDAAATLPTTPHPTYAKDLNRGGGALWSGSNKNRDVSTRPLAPSFTRSLAPLTSSLVGK